MMTLTVPAILAIVLGLLILAEMYSFTTRPMARPLSKRQLRRRYRQQYAKSLPSTVKMKALLAEARTHYL